MVKRRGIVLFLVALGMCLCGWTGHAEALKVGFAGREPFINAQSNPATGAAVEILDQVAVENHWTYNALVFPDIETGMESLRNGEIDILAGDIPITHSAFSTVEFSHPYFHSGLQILVPEKSTANAFSFLTDLLDLVRLEMFWVIFAAVFGLTLFVYWFEKKHNPDFPKSRKDGMAEAFYYVVTLALTGKSTYKGFPGVLGRLVMIVWIVLGIIVVAYVTSSITSAMTVEKLKGKIHGPNDLAGKRVAVVEKSAAQDYMREKGIFQQSFPSLDKAVKFMLSGGADTVVDGAPQVQTIDFKQPEIPVKTAGPVFSKCTFGFAFPTGSPLRLPFNRALTALEENGSVEGIFTSYFGPDHQN
ncbi:MAG: transporter substrate-binding domain-containing protein [Spartobacteria bacterium]